MAKETKPPNIGSMLIDVLLIGYGVFYFTRMHGHTPWRTAWAVGGICFGVIGLVLNLFLRAMGKPKSSRENADDLLQLHHKLYAPKHEYRPANLAEFAGVDADFYDARYREFEREGFRYVGDFENISATAAMPQMRTFLRTLIGDNGAVMAAIYDIRPRGAYRLLQLIRVIDRDFRTVDIETEFEDGTFLATMTTSSAAKARETPGITRQFCDRSMTVAQLLQMHRQRATFVPSPPRRMASIEDLFESQARMQAMKSAFRQKTGYVTAEDMERVAGRPLKPREQEVAMELERRNQNPQDEINS